MNNLEGLINKITGKKMSLKDRKHLARNVREMRKEKGLTQTQLGKKCGRSLVTISMLESGKETYDPNLSTLMAVAEALGVQLVDLFKE